MLIRRRFVEYSVLSSSTLAFPALLRSGFAQTSSDSEQHPLRLAVLGTTYRRGSNCKPARSFLVGYPFEGDWHMPSVQVVSMYLDEQSRRAALAPTEFDRAEPGSARRGPIDTTSSVVFISLEGATPCKVRHGEAS